MKTPKRINQLIDRLNDESHISRADAADELGKIGEPAKLAIPALVKALSDDYLRVRRSAAYALGKIDDPTSTVISALKEASKSNTFVHYPYAEQALNLIHRRWKLVQIKQQLCSYDFESADKSFQSISHLYSKSKYDRSRNIYVRKYIKLKLEKITQQLRCYNFESADELFKHIRHLHNASAYNQLRGEYVRKYIKPKLEKITQQLRCYNFESADELFKHINKFHPQSEYDRLRHLYVDEYVTSTFNQIKQRLRLYDFESADQLFQSISISNLSQIEYQHLKGKYQNSKAEYTKRHVLETITALLNDEEYTAADKQFSNSSLISADEYEGLKSRYARRSLSHNGLELNDEQSLAISKMDKHLLLAARAGSGKTRTIEGKTLFLAKHELAKHESPNLNQILILAFNKAAAKEIQDRICRTRGLENFNNARTFHSLAYQIVDQVVQLEPGKILFDKKGEFSRKELSVFVQKIFQDLRKADPTIEKRLYSYFRKELQETDIERHRKFFTDKEYLSYRRNHLKYVTLKCEQVKSHPEKYIADFLFEHDIKYQYEKPYSWENRAYRPDFTLSDLEMDVSVIIEHWGIDEHDTKQEVPSHWNKTWEEYRDEIQRKRDYWKRDYWQEKGVELVETSIRDLRSGRENFEKKLKSKLEHVGIKRQKLPESTVIKRIVESPHITRMTDLFVQFIQRAKKNRRTTVELEREIDRANYDERTQTFLEIANQVYSEYNQALKKCNQMDFDDLIIKATQLIDERVEEISIDPDTNTKINDLKWILIDEYQDFSKLFYQLIQSVRRHNTDVRLFCVGDDWQAINGFAGSDLDYFSNFERIIENSGTAHLLTNHRSNKKIVEGGNALMEGRGKPSTPHRETEGLVHIECVDDVKIEAHTNPRDPQEKKQDRKFLFQPQPDDYFLKAKYLKRCYQIITDNPGKTVTILARTNRIYGTELATFKNKLKRCFKAEQSGRFQISIEQGDVRTVHGFKGSEADIVIILQACNGMFPLIHPDNHLFEIFEYTIKDTFDEERRLFYVAITRAKEKLYILTERDRESDFLDALEEHGAKTGKYDDIPF